MFPLQLDNTGHKHFCIDMLQTFNVKNVNEKVRPSGR